MGEEKRLVLHYDMPKQVCKCCGVEKPVSEFYAQSMTGLPSAQCKECVNIKRSVVRNKRRHNKFVSKEKCRTGEIPEFSLADWKECMLFFRASCAYCGAKEGRAAADKLDRDHLVPISQGGHTVKYNIVPACRKCNRGRGNKEWRAWFRQQEFYTAAKEAHIDAWHKKGEPYED